MFCVRPGRFRGTKIKQWYPLMDKKNRKPKNSLGELEVEVEWVFVEGGSTMKAGRADEEGGGGGEVEETIDPEVAKKLKEEGACWFELRPSVVRCVAWIDRCCVRVRVRARVAFPVPFPCPQPKNGPRSARKKSTP